MRTHWNSHKLLESASQRALAVLGCAILLCAAGCGRKPVEATSASDTTIVFKHSKLFGNTDAFDALLKRFEKEDPGLRVKDETLPSPSDEQHQFYVINLQARSRDFDVLALDVV